MSARKDKKQEQERKVPKGDSEESFKDSGEEDDEDIENDGR
jgi:hypothetical protein